MKTTRTKWLKRGVWGFVFLTTLIALFYAEEDWRGARELARVKKEIEAKGESLDPAALIPPPIPDELNVAAAPIFAELYEKDNPQHRAEIRIRGIQEFFKARDGRKQPKLPYVCSGNSFSLAALQQWLTGKEDAVTAIPDVNGEFEKFRPLASEVETALSRPGVRWPVTSPKNPVAEKILYLPSAMDFFRFFAMRALFEIETGNGEAALRDTALIFRLGDVVGHRFLIGYLVKIAGDGYGYGAIAWGLEKGVWSEAQMERISRMLETKDYLAGCQEVIRQERLSWIPFYSVPLQEQISLRAAIESPTSSPDSSPPLSRMQKAFWSIFLLRPRGWQQLDEAYTFDMEQRALLDVIDLKGGTFNAATAEAVQAAFKKDQASKANFLLRPFSLLTLPLLAGIAPKTIAIQATLNEARIACALERWRLRQGSLPAMAQELVPDFLPSLPVDPVGGGLLHYVPEGDGYLLYSIGWNQKDDGGVIVRPLGLGQGDWVWASRPDLYKFVDGKAPATP